MQDYVQLSNRPCDRYQPDPRPTLVVTNPPWGARLTERGTPCTLHFILLCCSLCPGSFSRPTLAMLQTVTDVKLPGHSEKSTYHGASL